MGRTYRNGGARFNDVVDGAAMGVMGSRTAVRWAVGMLLVGAAGTAALVIFLNWYALISAVVVMSVLTFFVYGFDKGAARRGGARVPERVLHLMALLGGAAGALAGQQFFRHKTAKRGFQIVFWITAVVQIGLTGAYFWYS